MRHSIFAAFAACRCRPLASHRRRRFFRTRILVFENRSFGGFRSIGDRGRPERGRPEEEAVATVLDPSLLRPHLMPCSPLRRRSQKRREIRLLRRARAENVVSSIARSIGGGTRRRGRERRPSKGRWDAGKSQVLSSAPSTPAPPKEGRPARHRPPGDSIPRPSD